MDRELRILILEDNSTDAELAQRELRNAGITFSSMIVHTREEFIKGLDQFSPDLILADYKLPSFDGISALDISQEKCPDIPFIFVTGTMGEEWAVETLKRGAVDYVLKDRIYRLASVVKRALQDAKERTERKQIEEKYHSIFENILEGIFQTAPDGRYITANPAFVNMLGYKSSSEFIATVTDIGHQLYVQPERYNELKQLLDKHSVVHEFEIQMYRKDGSIIWISINARAICDDHGTLLYHEGTAQDITEQKKIRDAVKPSKLVLRIMGIFAVVEVLIMLVFSLIDIPHGIWENFAAAALLTILCSPLVYWWIVKGLIRHLVHEVTVAKTEAQANEYRYQTLIDTAQDIVYTLDAGDGKITLLNPAFETVTGWSRDEWIGKTFEALVHPDDLQFATETFQQILRGENPPIYELRILTKSGMYLVGEFTSVPQFELGKIVGVIAIARDITDRKRAEDSLRESERLLKESQVISGIGSYVLDIPARVWKGSEVLDMIFGITASDNHSIEGWLSVIHPNDQKMISEYFYNEVLGKKERFDKEYRIQNKKTGEELWVHGIGELGCDTNGNPQRLTGTIRDITERKHAEEKEKILQSQLQQAQKLESIGTLASGIAHDFNNILGIILGYSTLLGRLREDPQKHSESVVAITKATQRGALLVKQLLTFARKTEALFETVNINDMIAEITKLLKETFPKTITVSTSLQQDLPSVVADASQIHQVLLNLCVNARDAMPKSGTLSISTRTIEGEAISSRFAKARGYPVARQYVEIEVADTGIGMDESTRQRIFEPFFTTKPPGKGTGLGLAVVYGIVEHHTGFIDVRSAPGEGTSFTVYLPIPEHALKEVQQAKKSLEEIPGGTETILIIEDEEMLRELLKASLVSKGYTVLTAEDGMQGVEMYRTHQKEIAVVLSDMGLPLLSGQDVFKKIREINPEAKVIFASGFIEPEAKSQMYRAGLKNFIQKPYLQDEVLQKIREAIDAKG